MFRKKRRGKEISKKKLHKIKVNTDLCGFRNGEAMKPLTEIYLDGKPLRFIKSFSFHVTNFGESVVNIELAAKIDFNADNLKFYGVHSEKNYDED